MYKEKYGEYAYWCWGVKGQKAKGVHIGWSKLCLVNISFSEDPAELTIVRNALTSLFKMEPKGKFCN